MFLLDFTNFGIFLNLSESAGNRAIWGLFFTITKDTPEYLDSLYKILNMDIFLRVYCNLQINEKQRQNNCHFMINTTRLSYGANS